MGTEMMNRLFGDTYTMMNFEITFEGVKSWFDLAGLPMDDSSLFQTLVMPEHLKSEQQSELLRMIVYRYEDIFFQTHRSGITKEGVEDRYSDISEPIHQLLLQMMNKRALQGEEESILDLYLIIQQDRLLDSPKYPSLHRIFDRSWGDI